MLPRPLKKLIDRLSIAAVKQVVASDKKLYSVWQDSLSLLPDLSNHLSNATYNKEIEFRIRLLVVAETAFIRGEVEQVLNSKSGCKYMDVGDSDGSVRILLRKYFSADRLRSIGVNLQKTAVEKMLKVGLDAICADALTLAQRGKTYDIVSAFETLEHLPDPIGFLKEMLPIANKRLVLSIPYIRRSRVGLLYTRPQWPASVRPTIENTHIFELSPADWEKIFQHAGWKITNEKYLMMYPTAHLSRCILQPYWRLKSFEGFWFVSLTKDDTHASKYVVE